MIQHTFKNQKKTVLNSEGNNQTQNTKSRNKYFYIPTEIGSCST